MNYNKKVDFHSHYLSETYYKYLDEYEGKTPDCFPTPKWSAKTHLQLMDKLGIGFAFLSVSSPNLSRASQSIEAEMVHKINLEGTDLVQEHPDRFGLFASLPLPHVEDSIAEAQFALEKLKADGFGLSTNYAGVYLGDPEYDHLMEYLNRVGAVVAIHPVKPSSLPKNVNRDLPIPAMEFFMDTTRTFSNMVLHNIFERFPNIKWIFPHAGAFISILSDRMDAFAMQFRSTLKTPVPCDFKRDMKHVYFDLAGFPLNKQLHDLLLDVPITNLLYGSDMPYTPSLACIAQTGGLESAPGISAEDEQKIFDENAVALIPRLAPIIGVAPPEHKTVCYQDNPLHFSEKVNRAIRTLIAKVYPLLFS